MRALAAVVAALALVPATASAAAVGGGATALVLDPPKALGVTLEPTGPAVRFRRTIAFPVTGGRVTGLSGAVRHVGGLRLKAGRTKVELSNLKIVLNDHPFVQAEVDGGERLKAFTLDVDDAKISDEEFGTSLSGIELDLSRQGAKALNGVFATDTFATGTKLGEVAIVVFDKFVRFAGGQTDLALDPGAADTFAAQGITPSGSFAFPITFGRVNAETLAGRIDHDGGIVLSQNAEPKLRLTDVLINTRKAELRARVNESAARVAILHLDLNDVAVDVEDDRVTVSNIRATLTQDAAEALNQAFATDALQAGLTFGSATIRAVV